jgi:signal transduction histidine kinase
MTDSPEERIRTLRHDLSNPLSALLAEIQLQLMTAEKIPPETVQSLREMERLARRMREILHSQ